MRVQMESETAGNAVVECVVPHGVQEVTTGCILSQNITAKIGGLYGFVLVTTGRRSLDSAREQVGGERRVKRPARPATLVQVCESASDSPPPAGSAINRQYGCQQKDGPERNSPKLVAVSIHLPATWLALLKMSRSDHSPFERPYSSPSPGRNNFRSSDSKV